MVAALLIIKYIDSFAANRIFILFGSALCFIFASIECKNKPLGIIEKLDFENEQC